jgi:hypothetical protein
MRFGLACGVGGLLLAARSAASAQGLVVLGEGTSWRTHVLWLPHVFGTQEEATPHRPFPTDAYAPFAVPPGWWTRWDFDDVEWSRQPLPLFGGHGYRNPREVATILARAAFEVASPAQAGDLRLSVAYRGGIAAYLNGQEIARQHLPPGDLSAASRADDYPPEAFLAPGETSQIPPPGERTDSPELERRLSLRIRTLDVRIPRTALRPGRNVLALRLQRTAIPARLPSYAGDRAAWSTVGLNSVTLMSDGAAGITPNQGPPEALQVWNASPLHEITLLNGYADPGLPLRPLHLLAARGGSASAPVVVSRRAGLDGRQIRARISPLRHQDGRGVLPPDLAEVRYAQLPVTPGGEPTGYFDVLAPTPAASSPVQPVWFTLNVPLQAPPGRYQGAIEIAHGLGTPVRQPVVLEVSPYTLPPPAQYRSFLGLIQSPDTVALRYGAAPYSDAHFRLLDASLSRLGQAGSSVMYVTAIRETYYGNEHAMIRFRDLGTRVEPDFSAFDRYLDLWVQRVGPPPKIVVQVWEAHMDASGQRTPEIKLTRVTPRSEVEAWTQPAYGEPGTEALWRPVVEGLRQRLARRGWPADTVALGIGIDHRPHPKTVAFFRDLAPEFGWALFTHGRGDPSPQGAELEIQGMKVSYLVHPYTPRENARRGPGRLGGWDSPFLRAASMRGAFRAYSSPAIYRILPDAATRDPWRGVARIGFDFWPNQGTADTRGSGQMGRYRTSNVLDINLMRDNPRSLSAPGPDGPLGTVRFEMLREGRQVLEARIDVERALGHPALTAEDPRRAGWILAVEQMAAASHLAGMHGPWYASSGWPEMTRALFAAAAEAQAFMAQAGPPP